MFRKTQALTTVFLGFVTVPIVINEKNTFLVEIRGNIWKVAYTPELDWPETYYSTVYYE